jgi:hypothetical protein
MATTNRPPGPEFRRRLMLGDEQVFRWIVVTVAKMVKYRCENRHKKVPIYSTASAAPDTYNTEIQDTLS